MSTVESVEQLEILQPVPGHGVMRILDETGDRTVGWNRENVGEVASARAQFNLQRNAGFAAFAVKPDGGGSSLLQYFDPDVDTMIMVPPMMGG